MPNNSTAPIVIVGAGVAGLTLGHLLSKTGKPVIIVEQEAKVGGLTRSFRYDGFTFDIGPHRFHTDDQQVMNFILEILKDNHLVIPRKSGVYMFGKYFDWPLGSSSLFKLPMNVMVKSFFDLLRKSQVKNPDSFTEHTISQYGDTLYRTFFKHYTEKFIRIPCEDVHTDWALAGINRAVIDKRVKADTLFDLIKGVLLPKRVDTVFIYPRQPGVDNFCRILADNIRQQGSIVHTDTRVKKVVRNGDAINEVELSNGESVEVDKLIWSGEIHSLAGMLGLEPFPLRYLSMVCYNTAIKGEPTRDYQWIYYGDRSITINRISVPCLFNPANAPEGYSGVNVEITCFEGDEIWERPETMIPVVRKDLCASKLVRSADDIEEIWIERIRNTYPIYDLPYRQNLSKAISKLSKLENLMLLGRCGTFWYNNMDHSMKMAMDYAEHLLTGKELQGKEKYFAINQR